MRRIAEWQERGVSPKRVRPETDGRAIQFVPGSREIVADQQRSASGGKILQSPRSHSLAGATALQVSYVRPMMQVRKYATAPFTTSTGLPPHGIFRLGS